MSPRISVIVAAKNAERTLASCLRSLLWQDEEPFEIVVVDDASVRRQADTADIPHDDRIQFLRSDEPLGRSRARNLAISRATGEFVAIQDADDISAPTRLSVTAGLLEARPGVVACSSWFIQFDGGRYWSGPKWPVESHELRAEFAAGRMRLAHPGALLRRDAVVEVGGYRNEWARAEDFDLFRRLLDVGDLAAVPEALVAYRHPRIEPLALYCADRSLRRRVHGAKSNRLSSEFLYALTYPAYAGAMLRKRRPIKASQVPEWLRTVLEGER
jgi:glycosyltransferase involved in cell wall biosynthesis